MKHFTIGLFSICMACNIFCSCSDDKDKDPVKKPKPEPVSAYFISFKYNDKTYEIRGDSACLFSRFGESRYTITGADPATKDVFSINAELGLEAGKTYSIYNSSPPYFTANIQVMFTIGGTVTEEGYTTEEPVKIGELSITGKEEDQLSGTFSCRMKNGNITDGEFTVKETTYE